MIKAIATKLDQKSRVNGYWINLGQQFKISGEKLKEIEYGQFNPASVLMEYLYSKQEDLTVGRFYEEVKKLNRRDVLRKLEPFHRGKFCWISQFWLLRLNYFILCCIWLTKWVKYSLRWLDIAQGKAFFAWLWSNATILPMQAWSINGFITWHIKEHHFIEGCCG